MTAPRGAAMRYTLLGLLDHVRRRPDPARVTAAPWTVSEHPQEDDLKQSAEGREAQPPAGAEGGKEPAGA